jgi:hypothetical protein
MASIIYGACQRSQVEDVIEPGRLSQMTVAMAPPRFQECLEVIRIVYIVADKHEARMPDKVLNVAHAASQQVV